MGQRTRQGDDGEMCEELVQWDRKQGKGELGRCGVEVGQ